MQTAEYQEVSTLLDTLISPHLTTLALPAILLAVVTSWLLNGKVLPSLGDQGIALITPLVEETAKTLWAVALGASLVWTHLGFGLVEGLLEIKRRGIRGIAPGWLALVAHSLLGLLTAGIYGSRGLLAALAAAYLAHAAWNMVVVYCSVRQGKA